MTTEPLSTLREVELQLIKRAWSDPAFAQQLQENPRQAVEAALGVQLPAEITMQVLQESATTLYLVVPPSPDTLPAGELTDADLAAVAGGDWTGSDCRSCRTCYEDTCGYDCQH